MSPGRGLDKLSDSIIIFPVIQSFFDKETEKIFHGGSSRKLPTDIQNRAELKLRQINRTLAVEQLRLPISNRLEALKGDRKGFYSIRINSQWRIIFRWENGHAHDVQILDYH